MAVSKRLRYEVLRRDGFTCRYCGAKAPDVELAVDHVTPRALGGTDTPDNLVACCRDCNAGKSSATAEANTIADAADDALRWAAAMKAAYVEMERREQDHNDFINRWFDKWHVWTDSSGRTVDFPSDYGASISSFRDAGLSDDTIIGLIRVAMEAPVPSSSTWKYYCGCCWRTLQQLQERAAQILREEEKWHG